MKMSPASIQTQVFTSYCLPVQDRMAGANTGANTGVDKFDSMVRALHVYKTVRTPLIDETLLSASCGKIPMNMMNTLSMISCSYLQ